MSSLLTASIRIRAGLGLIVAALWLAPAFGGPDRNALSGQVRDGIGNLLGGVELLLIPSSSSSVTPVAVANSQPDGSFSIFGLEPGLYRIAALKEGYLTFIGRVKMGDRGWVDVVLRPSPEHDPTWPEPLPRNSSWALRLPRRSMLQETEARVEEMAQAEAEAEAETMRLQVDHLFDFRTDLFASSAESSPQLQGSETRMNLKSAIGARGGIRVHGRHQSLESIPVDALRLASQKAADLSVDFSYDIGLDARLAVRAFYAENQLSWFRGPGNAAPAAGSGRLEHAQRTWGYDATWSKQIDAASRVAVKVDYAGGSLARPTEPLGVLQAERADSLTNHSVSAAGAYEVVPADDHQVQVAVKAEMRERPLSDVTDAELEPLSAVRELSGYRVGIDAQDTWTIGGPFSLVYGLGYRHVSSSEEASLIVPKLGARLGGEGLAMRFLVSYHAFSEGASAGETRTFVPPKSYGYAAEAELPLGRGLTLTGTASSSPVQLEFGGFDDSTLVAESRPVYVSDGNAAVTQNRLTLVREAPATQAYLEFSRGRAEGTLSSISLYDMPLQILSERSLRYHNGRLGVRILSSGTHVLLEYRRMEEQQPPARSHLGEALQETVELSLAQEMISGRGVGDWRFLMAVRMGSGETQDEPQPLQAANTAALESLNSRISAGLSVHF